jgi:hypothetical protein
MATAQPKAAELTGHAGRITALAVGFDDTPRLWSGGADGRIVEWDLASAAAHALSSETQGEVVGLVAYQGTVVSAHAGGAVVVHGGPERIFTDTLVALASDGHEFWLATAGAVHQLGRDLEPRRSHEMGQVRCIAAFNGRVAVGREDGTLVLLDEWEAQASDRGAVTAVAVLGDDVISGGADGTVRVWDRKSQAFEAIAGGAAVTAVDAVHFGDERAIVSGHEDGTLQVVFGDKRRIVSFETGTEAVGPVALAEVDGRGLALTGGSDGTPHRWELDDIGARADKVEWLTDAPAETDALRREPLARALASRLRRIRQSEPGRSFLVHIDGAWGTGKSTILRFLGTELGRDEQWLVVNFNAWQRSRVGPPWWALLVALRGAVASTRGPLGRLALRIQEAIAQLRRTGGRYLIALAVATVVAAGLYLVLKPGDTESLGDSARSIAAVLAGIGTLWAVGTVVARMMLWDSAKGAKVYEQAESDPMAHVSEHFAWLVRRAGKPILFFIDDLDRCPGDYVVELLEAVQTLMRDEVERGDATYFVVAADGCWIRASYEQRYQDFAGSVGEPGRPLGYLFLDKLFQLTVRVPAVSALDQANYLAALLAVERDVPDVRAEVAAAKERLQGGQTDAEVVAVLEGASPEAREVLRETAIARLSEPRVQRATEHALERFAGHLEPNPRAMKRFVNEFGLARVVLTLEDALVPFDALARWTILSTRWPMLADRLREHPEEIELAGTDAAGVPDDVGALLRSRDVAGVAQDLTPALIEECVTGRSPT